MKLKLINNLHEKKEICENILRALPKWFGIEDSIIEYCEEVPNYKFISIIENEKNIGFISLKRHNQFTQCH